MKKIIQKVLVNSSRYYLEKFISQAAQNLKDGTNILDAGAGHCPYRHLFSHAKYESADFCQIDIKKYGPIDYVCDLRKIPVEDQRYDMVICTQVLEHMPQPLETLREFRRVLKPGGQLWLSAPFFFEEHETPYDFFRYTRYGLTEMFESLNFEVKEVSFLEGYYGTLSYQFKLAAKYIPLNIRQYGPIWIGILMFLAAIILKPLFLILSVLFSQLDMVYKNTNIGYCKNYCMVAHKK